MLGSSWSAITSIAGHTIELLFEVSAILWPESWAKKLCRDGWRSCKLDLKLSPKSPQLNLKQLESYKLCRAPLHLAQLLPCRWHGNRIVKSILQKAKIESDRHRETHHTKIAICAHLSIIAKAWLVHKHLM